MRNFRMLLAAPAFAAALFLYGCDQEPPQFKSPYLVSTGNAAEMEVVWQLTGTARCSIEWGDAEGEYGLGRAETVENDSFRNQHLHSYRIAGLLPGTTYYYRVQTREGSATGSFRTAPDDAATDLTFYAYGDTRTNGEVHDRIAGEVVKRMRRESATQTFVLATGDLVKDGESEADWTRQFFNPEYEGIRELIASAPFIPCRGNHEGFGDLLAKYFPTPTPTAAGARYFSFDYGVAHVAVIDQYADYGTASEQYAWLARDLAGTSRRWKFVVLHEPGWSAFSAEPGRGHENNLTVQRVLQPLFLRTGVAIVFGGHNHYYARADVDGVQHLTVGGGGAPLFTPAPGMSRIVAAAKEYHYCVVDIRDGRLTATVLTPEGTVVDTFALIR